MAAYHALLGFTGWTLLLVIGVFLYRGIRFLGGTPINSWPRSYKPVDDAPLVKRMEDAHANCLENLPLFAVIVLSAGLLGRLDAIAALAPFVLYARIGQSLVHLIGTGKFLVLVRASFWSVQVVLFVLMLARLFAP
jgi:uncharacterized MAPEG superfamily protein